MFRAGADGFEVSVLRSTTIVIRRLAAMDQDLYGVAFDHPIVGHCFDLKGMKIHIETRELARSSSARANAN
jgi:hypothetical protein